MDAAQSPRGHRDLVTSPNSVAGKTLALDRRKNATDATNPLFVFAARNLPGCMALWHPPPPPLCFNRQTTASSPTCARSRGLNIRIAPKARFCQFAISCLSSVG